jgi:hypothetical protein
VTRIQSEDTVTDDGRRTVIEFTVFGWSGISGKILPPIMQGWPVMVRTQEYSVLLQELKHELLECISLVGGDRAVSYIQNKGENKG